MNNQELLQPLIDFLRIPSISMEEKYLPDMERARRYLVELFSSLGFETQILKAQKHDAIFAQKIVDPKLPIVFVYGHYDVQPPEPLDEWKSSPFEPTIRDNVLYARGATDDKGQFMIHIMAVVKLLAERKELPLNVKFLIEGEEEISSPSVEDLVERYGDSLLPCDYVLISDTEMYKKDQPSIDISLRGITYAEIEIQTAKQDMHSGQFGGISPNPGNILSHIIAKLKDEKGRILIPGFYDSVVDPTPEELVDYRALQTTEEQVQEEGTFFGLGGGEDEFSINERRWSRPTLDVNGIWGGYQGEGSKTIIPAKAGAKISMRLVQNQDPNKIYNLFCSYVKTLVPPYAKVTFKNHGTYLPYKASTNHPVFSMMKQSLKKAFGKEPVFTGVGGSIGFVPVIANKLQVPCIMVGFGLPDDNLHSPNEHFSLDNYYKGIETMVDFYKRLSQL